MPVRVRLVAGKGKGLFLVNGTIEQGDVVAKMINPASFPRAAWEKKLDGDGDRVKLWGKWLPADMGVEDDKRVYYDRAMKRVRLKTPKDPGLAGRPPKWYRLNHGYDPNLEMKLKDGGIAWVAKRRLRAGPRRPVELTFSYKNPHPSWT